MTMTIKKDGRMHLVAPESAEGKRLDLFLLETDKFVSRHQVQKLISGGSVHVDGFITKPSHRLKPLQEITVTIPPAQPTHTTPEAIPLEIIHEDDDLLVVNKAAGMVVHPAAGHKSNTLVNALLHHCKDLSGIGGVLRPGIVHRLDKDTSGLLVVAKGDNVHQDLSRQFQAHSIIREYQGLVYGSPRASEGVIESAIGRHYKDRKKMSSRTRRGKQAVTQWKIEQRFRSFTLIRFTLKTGRTHQIRVHSSEAGYPIVGDTVYGRKRTRTGGISISEREKDVIKSLSRLFLHAGKLGFLHPRTNRSLCFSAPMPPDLTRVLETLEAQ